MGSSPQKPLPMWLEEGEQLEDGSGGPCVRTAGKELWAPQLSRVPFASETTEVGGENILGTSRGAPGRICTVGPGKR